MKKVIKTDKALAVRGLYLQGILTSKFLFISGQIAIVPETGGIIKEGI